MIYAHISLLLAGLAMLFGAWRYSSMLALLGILNALIAIGTKLGA